MPTFGPLFPEEIEIDPLIFTFSVDVGVMSKSADEIIAAQHRWNAELASYVAESGGTVYVAERWVVFFGFPDLASEAALEIAGQVGRRMSMLYPDATMLSVSTVGLVEDSYIHANIAGHLDDPKLSSVLFGRIKFNTYDTYLEQQEAIRQRG